MNRTQLALLPVVIAGSGNQRKLDKGVYSFCDHGSGLLKEGSHTHFFNRVQLIPITGICLFTSKGYA
jgi:hypothetical protein